MRRTIEQFLGVEFGNPSSTHAIGHVAKQAVNAARASVASASGASHADEIVFTDSATIKELGVEQWIARTKRRK